MSFNLLLSFYIWVGKRDVVAIKITAKIEIKYKRNVLPILMMLHFSILQNPGLVMTYFIDR